MVNVVLFEPEIPPNTGNIGRLCHALEAQLHLIEPLGFSIDEKSLRRAGLDYWKELNPKTWADWSAFVEGEAPQNLHYFTTKVQSTYWDATYRAGDYLVFGPETRGLPESLLHESPELCRVIPQKRGRSLNLATSVGIAVYEAVRQIDHSSEI